MPEPIDLCPYKMAYKAAEGQVDIRNTVLKSNTRIIYTFIVHTHKRGTGDIAHTQQQGTGYIADPFHKIGLKQVIFTDFRDFSRMHVLPLLL